MKYSNDIIVTTKFVNDLQPISFCPTLSHERIGLYIKVEKQWFETNALLMM